MPPVGVASLLLYLSPAHSYEGSGLTTLLNLFDEDVSEYGYF